jgi:hypothetical protein
MTQEANKALREAAKRGDIGGIRAALEAGARDRLAALADAVAGGHVLAAGYLLDRGASIRFFSVLAPAAVQSGSPEMLRFLLSRGLIIRDREVAIDVVAQASNKEILDILLNHCASLNANIGLSLVVAVEEQRAETVRLLLERGAKPETSLGEEILWDYELYGIVTKEHLLFHSLTRDNLEIVRALLDHGANPLAFGGRIMDCAEAEGREAILELLRKAARRFQPA